jgi:uncharacterized protein (DUF433 family)
MDSGAIIVRDLEIMGGTPCFRGTRVPFQHLLDYLETGYGPEDFIDHFPTVAPEAVRAGLEQARHSLMAQSA